MRYQFSQLVRVMIISVLALSTAGISLHADELHHTTQTDFAPGDFFQTFLSGSESHPEVFLDNYTVFNWTFDDDAISGWAYAANEAGNLALENPSGQIQLRAQFVSSPSGSYALAHRTDIAIPDQCSVEYRLYIDAMDPSGVADPFVNQPTGACCRLDLFRADAGLRVDIFSDRITSFYYTGSGIDYPVVASIDIATNTGQWYTFRFDVDFTDPGLAVQAYRDGGWIGELKADTRNAGPQRLRPMAFSRGSSSGLAEMHVDRVRFGTSGETLYSSGTYTSDALEVLASSFGPLSWTEVSPDPEPWGSWTKYAGNPVVAGAALVENMLADIDDPLQQPILYDGRYWLCYSSGGPGQSINLAYTTDPALLSWTKYESNPVLAPISGENYLFSPHLFKDGSTYYLFYDVALSSDSRQRISYATAPAPTGPWTRGQIVLERGVSGEWDDYRVAESFVIKEGDTYYLYYMGDHGCAACIEQIGVATTTSALFPLGPETGGHWTKNGIVLSPNPDPGEWDGDLVSNPSIVKSGDVYLMRYSGSIDNLYYKVGTAWATDPNGPYHRAAGPDIDLGPSGAWDDVKVLRGAVHFHNGQWYCLYTGNGETSGWPGYQGGIASASPRLIDDVLTFETRTSADAAMWEEWRAVTNGAAVQSSPEKYFQYRATFNESLDNLSPALTSVLLEYEQIPVATLITNFAFELEPEAVIIKWSVSLGSRPEDFRLVAKCSGGEWTVAHWTGEDGFFLARDESSIDTGAESVTYVLYHREDGGEWQPVHSETVSLTPVPYAVSLRAPYPNPFNPSTSVAFTVDARQNVRLTVYDAAGKHVARIADRDFEAGSHTVHWNGMNDEGRQVSSGVFFVRMVASKYQATRRIVLMR